jgi:hypothetical protein
MQMQQELHRRTETRLHMRQQRTLRCPRQAQADTDTVSVDGMALPAFRRRFGRALLQDRASSEMNAGMVDERNAPLACVDGPPALACHTGRRCLEGDNVMPSPQSIGKQGMSKAGWQHVEGRCKLQSAVCPSLACFAVCCPFASAVNTTLHCACRCHQVLVIAWLWSQKRLSRLPRSSWQLPSAMFG